MTRQARIATWVRETFGLDIAFNATERAMRAAEEVIELAQICNVSAVSLHRLVDYVFSRPVGEAAQEIGGCMVTIYAAAESVGVDADAALLAECERIERPDIIEKCKRRQIEKQGASVTGDSAENEKSRWTVVGLHERGKYIRDAFVCYIGGATAEEARDTTTRTNAERGDKIEVLACVAGGGVAHVFDPEVPARPTSASLRHDAALSKNAIREQRDALWKLLDDIDTLDDECREHDGVFREHARAIQKKRWSTYNPEGVKS